MATRTYANGKSGEIDMADGNVFRWSIQGDRTPEIYGWIEKDHAIVTGSGGWWRTKNPHEAVKLASLNLGVALVTSFKVVDGEGRFRCGPYNDSESAFWSRNQLAFEKPAETFVVVPA